MGKIFRDIWTEVIAAGVLAAMTTIIGVIQNTEPVIVAIIAFVIILVVFRVIYYFQEKRINKHLGIERERWNRVREEKIRIRKTYENRLEISKYLTRMNESVIEFNQDQLNNNISKKKWEQIAKDIGRVIPKHSVFLMLILPRIQSITNKKFAMRFITIFLVDITGVLNKHGLGSLEAEKNGEYAGYLKQVRDSEVGLPAKICSDIEANILLSKLFGSLLIFDVSQSAFRKIEINPNYANKFQYLLPTLQIMSSKGIGNIHESIEKWLMGD